MRNEDSFTLRKERKDALIVEIKNYFSNERGEEIGDLAALLFLDFILEKLAPEFYNLGVEDSYHYLKDASEDLLAIRK